MPTCEAWQLTASLYLPLKVAKWCNQGPQAPSVLHLFLAVQLPVAVEPNMAGRNSCRLLWLCWGVGDPPEQSCLQPGLPLEPVLVLQWLTPATQHTDESLTPARTGTSSAGECSRDACCAMLAPRKLIVGGSASGHDQHVIVQIHNGVRGHTVTMPSCKTDSMTLPAFAPT